MIAKKAFEKEIDGIIYVFANFITINGVTRFKDHGYYKFPANKGVK